MTAPTTNFEPLLKKQTAIKSRISGIANAVEHANPGLATKLRQIRDSLNYHSKAEVAIFDPNDKCSAFSFIEQTGALFGFDPNNYDFYADTKQTLDNIFDLANTIPMKILDEIDAMLTLIESSLTEANEVVIKIENKVEEGVELMNQTISTIENVKDRIQKDHKRLLFVLAALALPIEDVQMYLSKAKLFEQTVLSPCQGFYQAKFLEGFMDEFGFVDVENVLKQKDKIKVFMDSLPDSIF